MRHVTFMSALDELTISIPWASHAFEREADARVVPRTPDDLV